jgi:hypothetical protein
MLRNEAKSRAGRRVLLAVVGVVLLSSSAFAQKGGNPNPGVAPPSSGEYADLSIQWWQWVFAQPVTPNNPATTNPLVDTTGIAAHNGQPDHGNIFFLGGLLAFNSGLQASVTRSITIPTGTRLFFPILNAESDNTGNPVTNFTVAQLRVFNTFFVSQVLSMYVTVDGVSVNNLSSYRVISPVFSYTLPPNNPPGSVNILDYLTGGFVALSGLVTPAVSDGFFVLLTPLPPGEHLIQFGGTTMTLDQNGNPAVFSLDVTYHILVTPGH